VDTTEPRLGVDIGRVIIAGSSPDGEDTAFFQGGLDNAVRTPAVPGALAALAHLSDRFGRRVWLVSKCSVRSEARSLAWLRHHEFFTGTGIPAGNVRFCRRRSEKAPICAELGITHFIDDRAEVLHHMRGVVPHLFLFGAPAQGRGNDWLTPVQDWSAALRLVMPPEPPAPYPA
jgi:hypothetical protein